MDRAQLGSNLADWVRHPFGRAVLFLAFATLVLLAGMRACSSTALSVHAKYRIARDVTWYPFELMGKEYNMVAFTDDLLSAVAQREDIQITLLNVASSSLMYGLNNGQWDGVLSSLMPDAYTMQQYLFSQPFYTTGIALVVLPGSPLTSFAELDGQIVGIPPNITLTPMIAQRTAVFTPYTSTARAIDDLVTHRINALIMDYTSAKVYEKNIYAGKIRVVTGPVTDRALRLVVRRNTPAVKLVESFNAALKNMQEDDTYHQLLMKWHLIAS